MTVIRHMKTAAEDREVGVLLRDFDRIVARLATLGVDVFKLREVVPTEHLRAALGGRYEPGSHAEAARRGGSA